MPEQKPSVGRIVHFVDGEMHHHAALIVGLFDDSDSGVLLAVFDGKRSTVDFRGPVKYQPARDEVLSWHWPERV